MTGAKGRRATSVGLTYHVVDHILSTVAMVVYGDFEWDEEKAETNVAKHGVSFEEAATALVDPQAVFFSQDAADEARLVALGMSQQARVLFVVHVERGERDRIISARIATSAEEVVYEQGG